MPNRNYINGRAKEYRVMNKFKQEGLVAFRSAGSHSPIDVIGINPLSKQIFLIQCKPKSMSDNKAQAILNDLKKLEGFYTVVADLVQ